LQEPQSRRNSRIIDAVAEARAGEGFDIDATFQDLLRRLHRREGNDFVRDSVRQQNGREDNFSAAKRSAQVNMPE